MKKGNKGITLIALVVTIAVLLILAGVSITALVGENGLITRAKLAAEKTNQSIQNDISAMEELNQQLYELIDKETIENTLVDTTIITNTKPTLKASTNSITLTQNQTTNNYQVEYTIKKTNDTSWKTWSNSGNFTNLIFNTEYQAKTRVKNEEGEYIESEIEQIKTQNITKPEININIENTTPKTATATITYSQASGLTNQYSFNGTNWNTYVGPISISQDTKIYARNIDSSNQGSSDDLVDVYTVNIIAPTATLSYAKSRII